MRIHFGLEFDGQTWGGPPDAAAFDEMACGPLQLLAELESQLGIPSDAVPTAVRAAGLLPHLSAVPGAYWSRSAESDALGTAMRLVHDFDALTLAGWEPGSGSPRLQQLATLCARIAGGPGTRLRHVLSQLGGRSLRLAHVALYAPRTSFRGLWGVMLDRLAGAGVGVSECPALGPMGRGDLGTAASRKGDFVGDGSLQCLAPRGAVEAADHVAAWIAADRVAGTVIITPDAVLDTALARYGLPTLGLDASAGSGALQLVPLCLALAWKPIDPQHAVEMLSTAPNPLSRELRRRLIKALADWPAVGSPTWNEAAVDATEAERKALALLFTPQFDRLTDVYTTEALTARCAFLQTWFAELEQPPQDALRLCEEITTLMRVSQISAVSEGQMQRLLSWVMPQASRAAAYPSQAGLSLVTTPAAIVRSARRIVWWNFHDAYARVPRALPLTHSERQSLREAGLVLPTAGEVAAQTAIGWRQPLLAAEESLLLVAPRTSAVGEPAHPHPLWDELLAAVPRQKRAAAQRCLVVKMPRAEKLPPVKRHALRPLPEPATHVKVLRRELRREGSESPNSLETLLGCSYKWAMQYLACLDDGGLPIVTPNNLHTGKFAHQVIQALLLQPGMAREEAARAAVAQFDTLGPLHLAPLFLPGASAERDSVRSVLDRAARDFFHLRDSQGWVVGDAEKELSKPFEGLTLRGYLDLQLATPLAVVDFKWGGSRRYSDKLRNNTALQLAAYSFLSATGNNAFPPVAYYIFTKARLLTPDGGALEGGARVGGDVQTAWQALRKAVLDKLPALRSGAIAATGNLADAPEKDAVVDGILRIAPPCQYCDFSGLCGTDWEHAHDA